MSPQYQNTRKHYAMGSAAALLVAVSCACQAASAQTQQRAHLLNNEPVIGMTIAYPERTNFDLTNAGRPEKHQFPQEPVVANIADSDEAKVMPPTDRNIEIGSNAEISEEEPITVEGVRIRRPIEDQRVDPQYQEQIINTRIRREVMRVEVAYQILSIIDGVATVSCLQRRRCVEKNPLFGKRPSPIALIGGKLALGALHFIGIRHVLNRNPKTARKAVYLSLGLQGAITGFTITNAF